MTPAERALLLLVAKWVLNALTDRFYKQDDRHGYLQMTQLATAIRDVEREVE